MSTILRALKKLEHEKTSNKPDPTDIDLEFLDSPPPVPRRSPLKGILMVGLLLACGSGATYLFMSRTKKTPAPAPVTRPAAPQARQAVVLKPTTSARTNALALANRSSAASPHAASAPQVQAHQKPAPAASPVTRRAKVQPEYQDEERPVKKQRAPQIAKTAEPEKRVRSSASITVNGIALSDGEKRKAIVNGMSVSIGSVVEGARIVDIQENRVQFSRGNRTFEISVGNTGP